MSLSLGFSSRALNVAAFVILVVIFGIEPFGTFGHGNIGEISSKHPTSITPDGYAFSIWGVIWFFQAGFVIFQFLPFAQDAQESYLKALGVFWPITILLEAAWSFAFVYEQIILSFVIIFASWVFIFVCYWRLSTVDREPSFHVKTQPRYMPYLIYIMYDFPTALNLGWLTVATSAAFLMCFNTTNSVYGLILVLVVAAFNIFLQLWKLEIVTSAVLIWALVAIYIAHCNDKMIAIASIVLIAVVGLLSILTIIRCIYLQRKKKQEYYHL